MNNKPHSSVTREKMKKNNARYWLGKKHSETSKRKMSESRKGNKNALGHHHSSEFKDKMSQIMEGSGNWNWKGGITPERVRLWKGKEYSNWRNEVFQRDNYLCQICGLEKSGSMQANHIKKFSEYKNLRFVLDNGITLCSECHVKMVNYHEHEWESYFRFVIDNHLI